MDMPCYQTIPCNKAWYLLDSENQRAKQMTPQIWNKLKGSMYALAEGSGSILSLWVHGARVTHKQARTAP